MDEEEQTEKIADLNDAFRRTFQGGRVMMTSGIAALPRLDQFNILSQVQAFGGLSGEPFALGSERLLFLAEKPS